MKNTARKGEVNIFLFGTKVSSVHWFNTIWDNSFSFVLTANAVKHFQLCFIILIKIRITNFFQLLHEKRVVIVTLCLKQFWLASRRASWIKLKTTRKQSYMKGSKNWALTPELTLHHVIFLASDPYPISLCCCYRNCEFELITWLVPFFSFC